MRLSREGDPPPSGAGGMPGGTTGGLPGGSAASGLGRVRLSSGGRGRAAELASEAAPAEGASTTATRRGRRADRSAIQTTARGAWLAARRPPTRASSPARSCGCRAISSRIAAARRRLASRPAARRQAWQREVERPAGLVRNSARGLAWPQAGQRLAGACWTGGQEPLGSWGITRFLSSWLLRGSLGCSAPVVVAHHRGCLVSRGPTWIGHLRAPSRTASVKCLRRYVKCY
jgi:hypothetical protein